MSSGRETGGWLELARAFLGSPAALARRLSIARTVLSDERSLAFSATASLGILAALERRPSTLDELSAELGIRRDRLRRLLDAAVYFRVVRARGDALELRGLGRELLGSNELMADLLEMMASHAGGHTAIRRMMLDPNPDQARATYEHLRADPDDMRSFAEFMSGTARATARAFVEAWDPGPARRLLDIGGGMGIVSEALTARHPALEATVVDLPELEPLVEDHRAGIADGRVRFLGADAFTDELPTGHDAAVFARFLCDWSDDSTRTLLTRVRNALRPGGRVAIVEMLRTRELGNHLHAMAMGCEMLRLGLGDLRRPEQYRSLLEECGFRGVEVHGQISVVTRDWIVTATAP
ncbi:MAG: methyltransferase [Acidimicrobiia bacterium]